MNNAIHDNNNPNVPGNGSGLSGGAPVGTGMILAGSTYVTLSGNTVTHNGAWGELLADLPDQEASADNNPNPCQGGTFVPVPGGETCYFPAYGNVSESNDFSGNGFFGNPSNGDIGLSTMEHSPGNCFSGDSVPDGTDPPDLESNGSYRPSDDGMCTSANSGDQGVLAAEVLCDSQLSSPAPTCPRPTTRDRTRSSGSRACRRTSRPCPTPAPACPGTRGARDESAQPLGGSERAYATPRLTQGSSWRLVFRPSASTRSQPCIARPRISKGRACGLASSASVSSGST